MNAKTLFKFIASMRDSAHYPVILSPSLPCFFGRLRPTLSCLFLWMLLAVTIRAEESAPLRKAFIDGTGTGWRELKQEDFTHVNCDPETWSWTNGVIHSTGLPIGVIRTLTIHTNFELVVEWCFRQVAGNSGVFVWATPESIKALEEGNPRLPTGIEVQVLDHGYTKEYEDKTGKKATFFTTNGDVFPTGKTTMTPFKPTSPNGVRSFPSKNLSKGAGEWNHYYVRAINGEVRLWVNGEEVSGGTNVNPPWGYLCLEAEGAPIDFRNLRIRDLP